MPFINEFISPEDAEAYGLDEIDSRFNGGNASRQWTIDRDGEKYIRKLSRSREQENQQESLWTFYWKGTLLGVRLDLLELTGKPGGPAWLHWKVVRVNGSAGLPDDLKPHRKQILDDLDQALTAYADGGMFSQSTTCTVTVSVANGCIL